MRVIVTRPQQDAGKWVDALRQAGLDAVALPLIGVAGAPDPQAVFDAWTGLPDFDAVMFVSGNAVDHFFASKPPLAPVFIAESAIKTRAYVTGPASAAALMRAGVAPDRIDAPPLESGQFDSEALWARVSAQVVPGFKLLIVRGTGSQAEGVAAVGEGAGRDWFAAQVAQAGGRVAYVVAYQRSLPTWRSEQDRMARAAASDGTVWLFSSSEAIANLRACCTDQSWHAARAVATHPRIGKAARDAGFAVVCESRPTLGALVASIESLQ